VTLGTVEDGASVPTSEGGRALSTAIEWGSTAGERAESYPCEELVPDADLAVYRAIDISAPVPVVYRWLCQLRVAPYSYDSSTTWGVAARGS